MKISNARLFRQICDEIATYRQRQITTFRQFIIVEAAIAVGVGTLGAVDSTEGHVALQWVLRVTAAAVCGGTGLIGWWIIHAYKKRIYYLRDARQALLETASACKGKVDGKLEPFYPTAKENLPAASEHYETWPTSFIYSLVVISVGMLTGIFCFLSGWIRMPALGY
jgi:membrane protein YqaA with SNARE-associated domain